MHTFLDSKAMAKTLRAALAEHGIAIPHALSLELVARQFGLDDWNTLAARIEMSRPTKLPRGWHEYHSAAYPLHRIGIDPGDPHGMTLVAAGSNDVVAQNYATLMRSLDAGDYRGRSVRFSAELRGEAVGVGTIWLRIDALDRVGSLRFDNLMNREDGGALRGDFGWTKRSIVLDVPSEASTINYGPMLKGSGQLWARNVALETL